MSIKNTLAALAILGAVTTLTGCGGGDAGGGGGGTTAPAAAAGPADDGDKHKLYQASAMTGDAATIMAVNKKLGLMKDDGMPTDAMQKFMADHGAWAQANVAFLQELNSPEKAKAYVSSH